MKWNLIPRNPADGVKAPTPVPKEMRPLSAPEARRLLEAARDDRIEAFYVLALHSGMRRGELIEDGKRLALGEPKTKKSRRAIRLAP